MASIQRVLNCITAAPALEQLQRLSDDDWEDVAVTAIALGLAPLLHWHLDQVNLPLPALAMAKLAVTRQAHARRNEAIAGQLAEILAACSQEKIDVLILKGAVLAPTVYPEPALRPMNDIDLLFRPQDVAKAGFILESLGYEGKHKPANQGPGITKHLSTYRRRPEGESTARATPNPYLSPGGDRTVEPHRSLEESWFGLKVDITPGVWERAVPISLGGQPAYRLSTNDMVLHLAVHAAFHLIMGASVFLQLYDLGQVVQTWPDQLNWAEVVALTNTAQAQPFVYASLYWAKTLYQVPIPEGPIVELEKACAPNLAVYVKSLDGVGLFERTQQSPLVTVKQRLLRGLSDRRETARWASSMGDKWKVWQTAIAFHKTDTVDLLKKTRLKKLV